ncbi:MAG: STAS domain-containing protein [Bacteroidota bacterium]
MELNIVKESGEGIVLSFSGKLDAPGVDIIGTKFLGLLNHLEKPVFLDFSEVTYVSSIGIRLLLNGWKMVSREGFRMQIMNTSPEIRQVFIIAGFEEMLA